MYKADVRGEWQAVLRHERPGSALFCMLLASGWPSHVIPCKFAHVHSLSWLTHAPATLNPFLRIPHAQAYVYAPVDQSRGAICHLPMWQSKRLIFRRSGQ